MKNNGAVSINKKHRNRMPNLTTSLRILESTVLINLYRTMASIRLPAVTQGATYLCKIVCILMRTHHHDIVTTNLVGHNQFMLMSTGIPSTTTKSFVYAVTLGIAPRICHINLIDTNMIHMDTYQYNTRDLHHRDTIVALKSIFTMKKGRDRCLGERCRKWTTMHTSRHHRRLKWRVCQCLCHQRRLNFPC